jgi:ATP-binding cassette subfamily C protein
MEKIIKVKRQVPGFHHRVGALATMIRANPGRVTLSSICLVVMAFLDGIGVLALLPLLTVVLEKESGTQAGVTQQYQSFIEWIGFVPSLESFLVLLVCLFLLKAIVSMLASLQVSYAQADIVAESRLRLLSSLLNARWEYFVSQPSGKLANSIGQQAQGAGSLYTQLCVIISSGVQGAVYIGSAILVSWQATVGAAVAGIIMLSVLSGLIGKSRVASVRQTNLMESFTGRLIDSLNGIKPLKAMGAVDRIEPLLSWEVKGLRTVYAQMLFLKKRLSSSQEAIRVIALAAALYIAIRYFHYQLATLTVVAVLFLRTLDVVRQFQNGWQNVAVTEVPYERMRTLTYEADAAREDIGGGKKPTLKMGIEIKNVSFSYQHNPIFKNINLYIPGGQFSCILGPSGEGKTTLVDLVIGLLTPQRGEILLDGITLDEIDPSAWRRNIGYVPQEVFLFHDTLWRNITLGDPDFAIEDVKDALVAAGAWEFVCRLENGVETIVGERGGRLSGGQRQRISIARALIRKPKLLILDEATSALDAETEADIAETLRRLTPEMTILAITHRSSLVRHADLIFRLHKGKIQVQQPGTIKSVG